MSLVGNLAELGLGDILQIVSLGRKTGVLSICSAGRECTVFFRQGDVVSASLSDNPLSVSDPLFSIREQIENIIFSLFEWGEGTFRFQVMEFDALVASAGTDQMRFMLEQGLNPQFLALEGTRILDELRHNASKNSVRTFLEQSADDDVLHTDRWDASEVARQRSGYRLIMVDDDRPTLHTMYEALSEAGFNVEAFERTEDTLIRVDSLFRSGERPIVLIDLIMPKMDGSGVLGGLELLELLHNNFKELQLIIFRDYTYSEAEEAIRTLGYPIVAKPKSNELAVRAVVDRFVAAVTKEIILT